MIHEPAIEASQAFITQRIRRARRAAIVVECLACTLLLPCFAVAPTAAERPDRVANVLVFSTAARTPLILALGVDTEAINVTVVTKESLAMMSFSQFNATLTVADVMFVDRFLPQNLSYLELLVSHVNGTLGNDGLVMFGILQNGTVPGEGDFSASQVNAIAPILPVNLTTAYVNSTGNSSAPGFVIQVETAPSVPENSSILVNCIPWSACPLIDRRLLVTMKPNATLVLTSTIGAETVLAEWFIGDNDSSVMFFSMEITDHNFLFTSFPYFAYLMYVCTFHAMNNYSDAFIESWAEWPYSIGFGGEMP
ncbi:MAG: hypothetical protein Q6353_022875, partial [Candidatus Sigynarchaeum springense]